MNFNADQADFSCVHDKDHVISPPLLPPTSCSPILKRKGIIVGWCRSLTCIELFVHCLVVPSAYIMIAGLLVGYFGILSMNQNMNWHMPGL